MSAAIRISRSLRRCQNCGEFEGNVRLCPCGINDCRLLICARCEQAVRRQIEPWS